MQKSTFIVPFYDPTGNISPPLREVLAMGAKSVRSSADRDTILVTVDADDIDKASALFEPFGFECIRGGPSSALRHQRTKRHKAHDDNPDT